MDGYQVKNTRQILGMTQTKFAAQFKINLHTLRQWERKGSQLDSAVAAYLTCIAADPSLVLACLHKC